MTLANKLTFFRLWFAPMYFILFWISQDIHELAAAYLINILLICLVILAEITDALDGKLARGRKEVTDFGKLFDPFADYVTRFTLFFCFWWEGLFPAWMVVIIFYREAVISFLRLVVRGERMILSARKTGKVKAIFQATAIILILLARIYVLWNPAFPIKTFSWYVMLCVVLMTLYSMFDYLYAYRDVLRRIDM